MVNRAEHNSREQKNLDKVIELEAEEVVIKRRVKGYPQSYTLEGKRVDAIHTGIRSLNPLRHKDNVASIYGGSNYDDQGEYAHHRKLPLEPVDSKLVNTIINHKYILEGGEFLQVRTRALRDEFSYVMFFDYSEVEGAKEMFEEQVVDSFRCGEYQEGFLGDLKYIHFHGGLPPEFLEKYNFKDFKVSPDFISMGQEPPSVDYNILAVELVFKDKKIVKEVLDANVLAAQQKLDEAKKARENY